MSALRRHGRTGRRSLDVVRRRVSRHSMEIIIKEAGGWDSGWVQAWGSIAAIVVGFAYVAMQNGHATKLERSRQNEFRVYIAMLAADLERSFKVAVSTFDVASQTGTTIRETVGTKVSEIVAGELLAVSPNDCGSSVFTQASRKIGLYALAFTKAASHGCADGQVISGDTVAEMRRHLEVINGVMQPLRALAGLEHDQSPSS